MQVCIERSYRYIRIIDGRVTRVALSESGDVLLGMIRVRPIPGTISRMEAITQPVEFPKPAAAVLLKVATALGCSVECFAEPSSGDLTQTAEMLSLWGEIHRREDRTTALAFLRDMAAKG